MTTQGAQAHNDPRGPHMGPYTGPGPFMGLTHIQARRQCDIVLDNVTMQCRIVKLLES